MVWRDPVERFISAYTDKYSDLEHASRWAAAKGLVGKSVDEVLDYIEQLYAEGVEPMDIDEHLRKQSDYSEDVENVHVIVPIEKLDAFLATHGVKTARRNVSQRQKVTLSTDQVERVKALYAKDYELLTLDKVWKNKQ